MLKLQRLSPVALTLIVAAGCGGDSQGRLPIDGNVTFDGEPLAIGNLSFTPQQAGGVRSGAVIRDGRYSIDQEKGLPPGDYLVRIHSAVDAGPPTEPLPPGPTQDRPGEEQIPPRYNTQSELKVAVSENETTFDFKLSTRR